MHILMIFLDGIGLGEDDPTSNPFAAANTPSLFKLSNNHHWLASTGIQASARALFIPTDPRLGVPGRPQSGSGQAAILTGRNIPQLIGEHYGPKPNKATRDLLEEDNFFKQVLAQGQTAALLEAYPPRWHRGVNSGKSLRSSYQYAAHVAGLPIFGEDELYAGRAFAVDWTGEGWRKQLGYTDSPIYTPHEAGRKLVEVSRDYDFSFFSHWYTDMVGHRGTLEEAVALLQLFDGVMEGVMDTWDDNEGLVIITSDHGNMESIGDRRHTENDVPTVIIGQHRDIFRDNFVSLADYVPHMARLLFGQP
jgi:hypothetical protein